MRVLFIIIDGVGDRLIKGKTPLQRARKPNIDKVAKFGICGISDTIAPGVVPGSDTSHLAIFGYDPYKYYVGRGILEALGAGVKVYDGDIALRANFATVDAKFEIVDRRAGRIDEKDAKALAEEIRHLKIRDFDFFFTHTKGHRGVITIRGERIRASPLFTDSDPHSLGPIAWTKPLDASEEAKRTSEAMNEWTKKVNQILKVQEVNKRRIKEKLLPGNAIIARGASSFVEGVVYKGATYSGQYAKSLVKIERFEEKYGLSAVCVAGGPLYKGVARYLGMDAVEVKGATATIDTNLEEKVKATEASLKKYDFVFLHIKGCDIMGHDGNADGKKKFIEKIDKALKPLINSNIGSNLIVLTSDHSTPVSLKNHSADPVPIAICGPNGTIRRDAVKKFDEISLTSGGLGRIYGLNIMPIIMGIMGKAKMFGT